MDLLQTGVIDDSLTRFLLSEPFHNIKEKKCSPYGSRFRILRNKDNRQIFIS